MEFVHGMLGMLLGFYLGVMLMSYLHTPKEDPNDGDE